MNIDINSTFTTNTLQTSTTVQNRQDNTSDFASELSELAANETNENKATLNNSKEVTVEENNTVASKSDEDSEKDTISNNSKIETTTKLSDKEENNDNISEVLVGLKEAVAEMSDALSVNSDDNQNETLNTAINKHNADEIDDTKDNIMENMNIVPEKTDALTFQMSANMNFNSDGQAFSEFMNNENKPSLTLNESDLAEERAILSSMDENVAMAQKNQATLNIKIDSKSKINNEEKSNTEKVENNIVDEKNNTSKNIKTVINNEGIKKIDTKTNITVDTVVKFDSIIMDKNDVDFFVNLVENGQVDATKISEKSVNVSKTLAELIAKAMKDNQPIRIDFDNDISVIIKISKDGKISADFLPSSQIAEAYLKENLPLLRQRFDDNNIEYDELNQRKQKQDDKDNKKKDRKDE